MKHFSLMLVMVLFSLSTVLAQRTITGTVMLDGEGEAIGANVVIDGDEGTGTVTEFDGTFTLDVPATAKALKISYTGFETQIVSIEGTNTVNVTLSSDVLLDIGVVVTGYETLKKSDMTDAASVVGGEELQQVPIGNVQNLLQGKSTGLQVTAENGKPGAAAYVRLRGTGSANASNQPLYVVDGAQVSSTYLANLNPNDIESITVLKDASATAIYGSSGSNGVIVVNTKRGATKPAARPEITFSSQYGIKQKTPDNFDMMTAEEKMDYETELLESFGIGDATAVASYADQPTRDSLLAISGDWQDILLRNGVFQSYNISMGGSSERARYFMSAGYYDEEGISIGSSFDRMTARFTTDYDAADWLTIGSSLAATRTNSNELRDRYNVQNPFVAMYRYNGYESEYLLNSPDPTDIIFDENGNPEYNFTHQGFSISEARLNNPEFTQIMQFNAQLYAKVQLPKGVDFKTQLNGNFRNFRNQYFNKPGSILDGYIYGFGNPTGSASHTNARTYTYQWNNILTYSHTLKEKHNLNYLVGHEFFDAEVFSSRVEGEGFPSNALSDVLDNAAVIDGGYTRRTESAKLSFFGKVGYNMDSKYLASFTYRTDGSSSFGTNFRYGHFFAGSLGWNIHSEGFAENWLGGNLDQLKIRLSSGTSGNDTGSSSYTRLGTVATTNYGTAPSLLQSRPESADLRWEKNFSSSVGIDFGMYNNRITGAIDLYRRFTSDLLFDSRLTDNSGVEGQAIRQNIGSFINKGVEVELNVDLLRKKDFNLSVFGSFSLNDNVVNRLPDVDADPTTETELFDGPSIITEGEEYYTFYLVRFAGVDPATGDELFYDVDGNITNVYNPDDAVTLSGKSVLPKFFGSFGTNANYKGLNLAVEFYYNVGNYTYNQAFRQDLMSDGESIVSNQRTEAANFWREPGDITDIPRPTQISNSSDRWLQRGDYLRLRNVRLGYSIPVNSKWLSSVNIFGQATNLVTWTNFDGDPEVGTGSEESDLFIPGQYALYSYPQARAFTLGLNLSF